MRNLRNLLIIGTNGNRLILGASGVPAPEGSVCAVGLYDPTDADSGQIVHLRLENVRDLAAWIHVSFPGALD